MIEKVIGLDEEFRLDPLPELDECPGVAQIELIDVRRARGVATDEERPRSCARSRTREAVAIEDRISGDILLIPGTHIRQQRELVVVEQIFRDAVVELSDWRPYGGQRERVRPVDGRIPAVAASIRRVGDEDRA